MMEFRPVTIDKKTLKSHSDLLRSTFPGAGHFDQGYLHWLYAENPDGTVVGVDAYDGEILAGHYVCVPARVEIQGQETRALLSLNTAVRPDYQGQGLFTRMAQQTYESAVRIGYGCVFGVANANSTPGFVGKLGFQLVAQLGAKLGVGRLGVDWETCEAKMNFRRAWRAETAEWRASNPNNRISIAGGTNGPSRLLARSGYPLIAAYSECMFGDPPTEKKTVHSAPVKLFIGMFPKGSCTFRRYVDIPDRLRPSPLNLIYRSLGTAPSSLDPEGVMFGFQDFDAY